MLPTGTRAKNIVASYVRKRHRPKSSMKHVTCCQSPPHKSTSTGEEEECGTWLRMEATIAVFVIINFAFKIGKSPLAAKRE